MVPYSIYETLWWSIEHTTKYTPTPSPSSSSLFGKQYDLWTYTVQIFQENYKTENSFVFMSIIFFVILMSCLSVL